ncbi:response regulator [Geodermatophilus sp. SYSU D00815]
MITVLLVDDHALLRDSIASLLEGTPGIRVVGECGDGAAAVDAAARLEPDVVLMDIAMPGISGLEAARRILAARPGARVVMLTGTPSGDTVRVARDLGVSGYLLKDDDPAELPAQVRAVAAGGEAWSAAVGPRPERSGSAATAPELAACA